MSKCSCQKFYVFIFTSFNNSYRLSTHTWRKTNGPVFVKSQLILCETLSVLQPWGYVDGCIGLWVLWFQEFVWVLFVFILRTDSIVERQALRQGVFPRLREHCRHTLGLDVTVSKLDHINFVLSMCSRLFLRYSIQAVHTYLKKTSRLSAKSDVKLSCRLKRYVVYCDASTLFYICFSHRNLFIDIIICHNIFYLVFFS